MRCSVIIPVRNSAHTLAATLASVLAQEDVDFEVVVVDDGSLDAPAEVVTRLGDPRVTAICQAHAGVGAARNHGAARSSGDAVVFLDADDEAKAGWLAALTAPLLDPTTALASCAVLFRRGDEDWPREPGRLGSAFHDVNALFLAGAFCVRRDLWNQCGGYEPALRFGENTELGLRLASHLQLRGLRAAASTRPLLISHRAPLWLYEPTAVAASAAWVLKNHQLAARRDRRFRFDYLTAHGVNSARSNRWKDARASLRTAWKIIPTQPAAVGRALLASAPPLGRWVWTVSPGRSLMAKLDSIPPATLEISVVIPSFQGGAVLGDLLASLAGSDPGPWEVVVADNGSTDITFDVAARFADVLPIRLIDASGDQGVAAARNAGAAVARGRKLLFVDQDDVVTPGFVAAMADALNDAHLVGPRIDCASLNAGWLRHSRSLPQERGLGQDRLPWVYGSGLGVRREVFLAAGGFDREFKEGCEDVDLCWRLVNLRYRIAYVPDAVLRYRFRSTIPALFHQARSYGRAGARLQAIYRAAGVPPPSPRVVLRHWLGIVKLCATARTKAKRARAAVLLGNRIGRLEGALRHRVLYG